MEPQVKERIVGAAVLVALGVWLIPWVLDGRDEVPADRAATDELTQESSNARPLNLPSADAPAPVRTETVELEPREPSPEPSSHAAADEARESGDDARESGDDAPVAVIVPEQVANAARDAPAEPGPEAPAPPQESDRWAVQLGAFSEATTANQLAARVSTYGYTAAVSEVQSGGRILHRVRVGGLDSENEAEATASSLSAHGFPVRVIAPE